VGEAEVAAAAQHVAQQVVRVLADVLARQLRLVLLGRLVGAGVAV
jgi:hypothetical protein